MRQNLKLIFVNADFIPCVGSAGKSRELFAVVMYATERAKLSSSISVFYLVASSMVSCSVYERVVG